MGCLFGPGFDSRQLHKKRTPRRGVLKNALKSEKKAQKARKKADAQNRKAEEARNKSDQ